jgi:hypothetical protein
MFVIGLLIKVIKHGGNCNIIIMIELLMNQGNCNIIVIRL